MPEISEYDSEFFLPLLACANNVSSRHTKLRFSGFEISLHATGPPVLSSIGEQAIRPEILQANVIEGQFTVIALEYLLNS